MPNDLQDLLKDLPKVDSPPMFQKEEQKKREAKFWSNYPVDPLGFTIDPRRPLVEGKDEKGRPIQQTERSIGVFGRELLEQVPSLKGIDRDAMYNIPSIWHGKAFGESNKARKFAAEYMKDMGWIYPNFKGETKEETIALAKKAAQNRSDSIQGGRDSYGLSRLLFER